MRWRTPALLFAVAIASHATALAGSFVWTEHRDIELGRAIAAPLEWLSLFTRGFGDTGFYRPLVALSLSIDAIVGAPWIFHLTSVLWHGLAVVLCFAAAGALGSSRRAATIAAAVFAVHPVTALVAGVVAFRSEAMLACALFGLVVAHRQGRRVLAALALLAGALSKETAFVLGPAFVAVLELDLVRRPRPDASPRARGAPDEGEPLDRAERLRLLAAEGAALVLALALRLSFAPPWRASNAPLALGDAIGTRLAVVARAALTLVAPIDLRVCDATTVRSIASLAAALGIALLAAIIVLAWRARGPMILFALSFAPILAIVPVPRLWSIHYLYVPLAFGAMAAAAALDARAPARAPLVAGLLAAALAVATLVECARLGSDVSLWEPEVRREPACREGQFYLGEARRKARDWEGAARFYTRALAVRRDVVAYVDRGAALQNLGVVRLEEERWSDAADAFREAYATSGRADDRGRRELRHNFAVALARSGQLEEASRVLAPEVARRDAMLESIYLRARVLHELGREIEARELLRRLQREADRRGARRRQ